MKEQLTDTKHINSPIKSPSPPRKKNILAIEFSDVVIAFLLYTVIFPIKKKQRTDIRTEYQLMEVLLINFILNLLFKG